LFVRKWFDLYVKHFIAPHIEHKLLTYTYSGDREESYIYILPSKNIGMFTIALCSLLRCDGFIHEHWLYQVPMVRIWVTLLGWIDHSITKYTYSYLTHKVKRILVVYSHQNDKNDILQLAWQMKGNLVQIERVHQADFETDYELLCKCNDTLLTYQYSDPIRCMDETTYTDCQIQLYKNIPKQNIQNYVGL
jgi:hypothetical protein